MRIPPSHPAAFALVALVAPAVARQESYLTAYGVSHGMTVLGSVVVGLVYSFGVALAPDLLYFVLFGPMLLVLVLRPRGLLGGRL